jgi:hypothetical protein
VLNQSGFGAGISWIWTFCRFGQIADRVSNTGIQAPKTYAIGATFEVFHCENVIRNMGPRNYLTPMNRNTDTTFTLSG